MRPRVLKLSFRRYLAGNIARGFAADRFLREHSSPPKNPSTLENE